jgi:Domain of unknown function (DUF4062)
MDKRYQVFVSSTYADLKEERRRVIQAVIEMDCIPAGMELFPATDEEQFEFIKRVIDDCDYYLLIIGGRYGSTTAEGISYTEKEYEYAISKKLRVIALIHQNPGEITFDKSEQDPVRRDKLKAFREKVSTGRLVKHWKSAEQLAGLVIQSLAYVMKTHPAVGWIRANRVASEDLLTEINGLRKENAQLKSASTDFRPVLENLASLDDEMVLVGKYHQAYTQTTQVWLVHVTWRDIFAWISPYLIRIPADEHVRSILASAAFLKSDVAGRGENPTLNDQNFRTVAVQLQALGLVKLTYGETTSGGMGLFWSLTPSGERLMMELRTVKKVKTVEKILGQTTGKGAS